MIEFKLPSLGADMDEGTLLEWKVGAGDTVKKGQVVAVVDTAKAAIDVECWQAGTVHELVAEVGQKMPVGTVMATLLEAGEAAPPAAAPKVGTPRVLPAGRTGGTVSAPAMPAPAATQAALPGMEPPRRRMISPAARKHAAEKGVDLDRVVGTGPHGAVTLEDVEKTAVAVKPPPPAADKAADRKSVV